MNCPICDGTLIPIKRETFLDHYIYTENSKQCKENISYIQGEDPFSHFEFISEDKLIYRFSDIIASRIGDTLYVSTYPFNLKQSIAVPNFSYSENFLNKIKLYIKLS